MNAHIAWWIMVCLWAIFFSGWFICRDDERAMMFNSLQFSMVGFMFIFLGFINGWW